ncbi:MAG: hypothetical protein AAF152_03125 [Cyanobacteria bacterium P01_A01_bin.114]
MEEQIKKVVDQGVELAEDALKEVTGGQGIQQRRLDHLDTNDQSKSVDNIQETRLDQLDTNDQSK